MAAFSFNAPREKVRGALSSGFERRRHVALRQSSRGRESFWKKLFVTKTPVRGATSCVNIVHEMVHSVYSKSP